MEPDTSRTGSHDGEIVAIIDGTPTTWREVAEKAMELDLKNAVDIYVKWKVFEDLKKKHSISHTQEELKDRAKAVLEQCRKVYGEDELKRQLEAQKMTEEQYTADLLKLKSAWLSSTLDMEKLYRYSMIAEGWIEIDRMVFFDAETARAFDADAKAKGFTKAVEEWEKRAHTKRVGRVPRQVFSPALPPKEIDDTILKEVLAAKAGDVIPPTQSHVNSGMWYVIRVTSRQEGRTVAYAEVKDEIMAEILKNPPTSTELKDWFGRLCAGVKVLYQNKGSGK